MVVVAESRDRGAVGSWTPSAKRFTVLLRA